MTTPESARMCVPRHSMVPDAFLMTSPRTPRSPTRTLAPSPRTIQGTAAARAAVTAFARSSPEVASYKRSAGPPIRNVVSGASGTAVRNRRSSSVSGKRARIASPASRAAATSEVMMRVINRQSVETASWRRTAGCGGRPSRAGGAWSRGLLVGFLLALVTVTANGQRAQLEKIIQRQVLANGLEVIVIENHGVPLVTVEVTVRNGAFTQSPEYAGLAHLYEHMFFKANATYPEPDQYVDEMSRLGAVFNASTREEQVNYYLTLSADSLEAGLRLLATGFLAPIFREDELERERQVVIGEYDRNESSPFFRLEQETGR